MIFEATRPSRKLSTGELLSQSSLTTLLPCIYGMVDRTGINTIVAVSIGFKLLNKNLQATFGLY
jgi:hypothetical protein